MLPYKDHVFDVIICSEVLEHLKDPQITIQEIQRIAKPGCEILITVPNERNLALFRLLFLRFPIHPAVHVWAYTPKDIEMLFGQKAKIMRNIPYNIPSLFAMHYAFKFVLQRNASAPQSNAGHK